MLVMAATGATGAITALGDTLFPASSLAEGLAQKAMSDAHPFVRMRNWHPAVAVIAAMALGLAGRAIADASASTRGRRLADGVALACLVQLGVGALNVFLLAPVWMQLLHLAMADAIWIGATWMITWLHRGLLATLVTHRGMLCNPRYGRIGMISMPFFVFGELIAPLVSQIGHQYLDVSGLAEQVIIARDEYPADLR